MPNRYAGAESSRQNHEPAVDSRAKLPWVVQGCNQEHYAERDRSNALEYAEGARVKKQNMLGVQRKAHHAGAREKACKIQQALTG